MTTYSKQGVMTRLIAHGQVIVHFDPAHKDTTVPEHLRPASSVCFAYGYNLVVPIPDLAITEHGISATLSFNRRPQYTFVPWDAVFSMVDCDGEIRLWPESIPAAVVEEANRAPKHPAAGFLHLVKGGSA